MPVSIDEHRWRKGLDLGGAERVVERRKEGDEVVRDSSVLFPAEDSCGR